LHLPDTKKRDNPITAAGKNGCCRTGTQRVFIPMRRYKNKEGRKKKAVLMKGWNALWQRLLAAIKKV
jgi:hypothetical protein